MSDRLRRHDVSLSTAGSNRSGAFAWYGLISDDSYLLCSPWGLMLPFAVSQWTVEVLSAPLAEHCR